MKSLWIDKIINYDGSQLRSLYAYLEHGVLGTSIVAWRGSCSIPFENMIDGEDLLDRSEIKSSDMVHFIIEIFHQNLFAGVCAQRLFASVVGDVVNELSDGKIRLRRSGDDLYKDKNKFSISIASVSNTATLVHFAVNISNKGTPVPTCSLEDFGIDPKRFALQVMDHWTQEFESIEMATMKVRSL
jgi:uncharacterized protein